MTAAQPPLPADIRHEMITVNGVDLHVALAGPEEGRPVLLLHGFPELWYGWRNQIAPLADAGHRVIVPDQRGYNLSSKPAQVKAYAQRELALDVTGLLDHFGYEQTALVGHDWGGAVAWWTALQHPERVERLAVLNLPHPIVFNRALRGRQALRSWYILLFQLPWLPEALLGRKDCQPLVSLMRKGTLDGALSREDLELYREAYLKPGALTAMLNWYRAIMRAPSERLKNTRAAMPVKLIWGARDTALGVEMAAPSVEYCDDGELHVIDEAGHFVQHDAWQEVNELLLGFLKK